MAVADAAKKNIKLDYSIESLKSVDTILAPLHKEFVRLGKGISKEEQEGLMGYAEMYGCYLLAVADKNKIPGKLTVIDDQHGAGYGFTDTSGFVSDFISWCYKAIVNGETDAVSSKFAFLNQPKQ